MNSFIMLSYVCLFLSFYNDLIRTWSSRIESCIINNITSLFVLVGFGNFILIDLFISRTHGIKLQQYK